MRGLAGSSLFRIAAAGGRYFARRSPASAAASSIRGVVRKHLGTWEKPALLALAKDLFEAAAENRDFVEARCFAGEGGSEVLESYRNRITEQFYPARGFGKLKLGEARKAIRAYRKATNDLAGTAELLMTYVENGASFACDFGNSDERFYNSMESALDELADLLHGEARGLYPQFQGRLASLAQGTKGIGWGFHDSSPTLSGRWKRSSAIPQAARVSGKLLVASPSGFSEIMY